MKLTVKDPRMAVVDDVFEAPVFTDFWRFFNTLDFAYRSMTGWQKVWRINDGQILAGMPYYQSQFPFNCPMDWLSQIILQLARDHLQDIVGKEGEDWKDILYTPYIYPSGTKISWHDDYGYSAAAIFYPHLEWNPHWGGELLIAKTPDPESIPDTKVDNNLMTRDQYAPLLNAYGMGTYISPLPNRIAFTSGKVWHSINRVDQAAGDHMRCSVVAFFLKEKFSG